MFLNFKKKNSNKVEGETFMSQINEDCWPIVQLEIYGKFTKKKYIKNLCKQIYDIYDKSHKLKQPFYLLIDMTKLEYINPQYLLIFGNYINSLKMLTDKYLIASTLIITNVHMKHMMNTISTKIIKSSRPNYISNSLAESICFLILCIAMRLKTY